MFLWYKDSEVCYSYLQDVKVSDDEAENRHSISRSRWFTRGWTLQELIAPSKTVFYSQDWKCLGTKSDLRDLLHIITGIEPQFLCGEAPLEQASIAKRMSWAAKRDTSRTEDIAYCLLGLFDVTMPLLYGEGRKAFRRLQEELMRAYPFDHSLFAWGKLLNPPTRLSCTENDGTKLDDVNSIPWDSNEASKRLRGLFAHSPHDFIDSGDIAPSRTSAIFYETATKPVFPHIVGRGVRLELAIDPMMELSVYHWPTVEIVQLRLVRYFILICHHKGARTNVILLPVVQWGHDYYGRTDEIVVFEFGRGMVDMSNRTLAHIEDEIPYEIECGDIIIRFSGLAWQSMVEIMPYQVQGDAAVTSVRSNGIITTTKHMSGTVGWCRFALPNDPELFFTLLISRIGPEEDLTGEPFGPLNIALVPCRFGAGSVCPPDTGCPPIQRHGLKWTCAHYLSLVESAVLMSHTFSYPEDSWKVDLWPFPEITISIKRVKKSEDYYFDLLDIRLMESNATAPSLPKEDDTNLLPIEDVQAHLEDLEISEKGEM